jgi:hypothetical protein
MTIPLTGVTLTHTTLTQNISMWKTIEEWKESHSIHLWMTDIEMEGGPIVGGSFKNVYRGSLLITVQVGTSK